MAVGHGIVWDEFFSSRITGDNRLRIVLGDQFSQPICVIGLVGKKAGEWPGRLDQGRSDRDITGIARRERQDPRPAQIVRQGVDLGGAATP